MVGATLPDFRDRRQEKARLIKIMRAGSSKINLRFRDENGCDPAENHERIGIPLNDIFSVESIPVRFLWAIRHQGLALGDGKLKH